MDDDKTTERPTAAAGQTLRRLKGFVKEHPTASVVVAASAGLLLGPGFVVGATLGVGATLLFVDRPGQEMRQELQRRFKELYEAGAKLPEQLIARGKQILSSRRHGPDEPGPQPGT
jgi:hypothetical protein